MADDVEELHGDSQFPEDTAKIEKLPIAPLEKPVFAPRRLSAYEMSSYATGPMQPTFGMDRDKVAAFLRTMAERFESGEYSAVQEASLLSRAERDNYAMTYFTLVFHQKTAPENT